jgi:RiboL-PSP-HEPN
MFITHAERIRSRVDTIWRAVQAADRVRTLLAEPAFDPSGMPPGDGQDAGQWLKTNVPTTVAWKEFDHNAALTALYAAYESCIYDILVDWITNVMPVRWPSYPDHLPEEIQNGYVAGVAKLMPEMGKGRYRALSLNDVTRNLADSTGGSKPYHLHPEAFFTKDQNLRFKRLNELLGSVGMDRPDAWLCRHPLVIDYLDNVIGGGTSLDNELSRFVQARNDAAHGYTGTYLGITELEHLSILAERLGTVVVEKARHDLARHYISIGRAQLIGPISEVFKDPKAVIVKAIAGIEIVVGAQHVMISDTCCEFGELLSCRVDEVSHATFVPTAETEVGLKFTCLPREGVEVFRLLPPLLPDEFIGAFI